MVPYSCTEKLINIIVFKSPHLAIFLGSGGDFVGYLLGGKFDVVHEGLLGFVAADVHHLDDVVFVAQVHVGDSGTSGGMARHAFEERGRSTLPFRSVSGSLPSFFNASFCFIVRLVGTFSFSVGTLSDRSSRISLM